MARPLGTLTEIADAIRQSDYVAQRKKEIGDYADQKMTELEEKADEQVQRIPEVEALRQEVKDSESRVFESIDEIEKALSEITVDGSGGGEGELINFAESVEKGYYDGTGTLIVRYAGYMHTNSIRVKKGDVIEVTNPSNGTTNISSSGVVFDADGVVLGKLTSSGVRGDYSATISYETAHTVVINLYRDNVTDYTVLPADLFVSVNKERKKGDITKVVPLKALENQGEENVGKILSVDEYGNVVVSDIDNASVWSGKNGVAFGTSLTARARTEVTGYGYLMYLPQLLGITVDNQGHSSAYWCHWTASSTILNDVLNYEAYDDKDFCIIEGCVNDWSANRTLGTYTDTETSTVCGCLHTMIEHIYEQNNDIQILVIIDHYGKATANADCSYNKKNNGELTQYEYYAEIEKCCLYHGIPYIKEFEISSIGKYGESYLADQIHLNDLGAKQSAKAIARQMNLIVPKEKV